MTHIIDCGVNPRKPQLEFSIATIREKKSAAYDYRPARKGSKKYKAFSRAPQVTTLLVYGKFDNYSGFAKAVRESLRSSADDYDLRTIQFWEGGSLPVEETGVLWINPERD